MNSNKANLTIKTQGFNISEVAIKNPVPTIMMILTLLVLGFISYGKLSVELFPNISFPVVTIRTFYPGASAEEVETLVTKPIEDAVSSINGVEHIRSISANNLSSVIIEFKLEKDIKDAANETREKLALIRSTLPDGIEEPVIARVDFDSAPIINYAISGPYPLDKLTDLVKDNIKPKLEQVEGVAGIDILGSLEREVQVTLDPDLLQKYNLTLFAVQDRLKRENLNFPSGEIKANKRDYIIRTINSLKTTEEIANLPITIQGGKVVYLKDLGLVTDGFKEVKNKAWLNGVQCVVISIQKQSGGNTVKIVKDLNKKLEELKLSLPKDIKIEVGLDSSKFIVDSKDAAIEELIIGAILAVLVIYSFLRMVNATIISAIAIPTSVISTYTMLYALNFSINTMTLLALSLVVGILVDDAVVDIENIFRHIQMGKTPYQAAIDATNEIGLAVVATSFSIIAVFIPIAFMTGIIGQFFKQFGLTVSFAVLISLLVARTLTPTLAAYILPNKIREEKFFVIADTYKKILKWALEHRKTVIFIATFMFFISLPIAALLPTGFQPKSDRDEFSISVELPAGSNLNQTTKILKQIENRIKSDKNIKNLMLLAGNSRGETYKGTVNVMLYSKQEGRKENIFTIQKRLQKLVSTIPGARISFKEMRVVDDGTNYALNLSLRGDSLEDLQRVANKLLDKIRKIPIVTDTNLSTGDPQPEIHITIDRDKASLLGISASTIAATLKTASIGDIASTMHLTNTNIDIRVRLVDTARYNISKLSNLGLMTNQGIMVPLSSVANITYDNGPTNINRYDRQRQVIVYANVIPGTPTGEIVKIAEKELKAMKLPPNMSYDFLGEAKRMRESFSAMGAALIIGIIFIYIILASQFGHFANPLVIMMALPLAFVGAFLFLFIANKELSLMSLIGIVMLMGLVTKNSILLIDYVTKLRRAGLEREEAILIAGGVRLRPILMTTIAMIAGMTPIALQITIGSDVRSPMAIAVIGGLITSTLLTLIVVPVSYTIMDDIIKWLGNITKINICVPCQEQIVINDEIRDIIDKNKSEG